MLKEKEEIRDTKNNEDKGTSEELENRFKNQSVSDLTAEEKRNLFGFFALALKVDRRNNPNFYKPVASGMVFPVQAGLVMA